jgi:hypothetical protein
MKKKAVFLTAMALLAAAAVWLLIALPTDRQLIATASTHDNIQYLTADAPKLEGGRRLRFAAYDADCGTVQLCFSVKKNDRALRQGKDIAVALDGAALETWKFFTHTTWKRTYHNFLLENVAPGAQITFTYHGQTITIE